MDIKACNLTEDEIKALIGSNGSSLWDDDKREACIERINYLNKRLKEFSKPAKQIVETAPVPPPVPVDGWSNNNGA